MTSEQDQLTLHLVVLQTNELFCIVHIENTYFLVFYANFFRCDFQNNAKY